MEPRPNQPQGPRRKTALWVAVAAGAFLLAVILVVATVLVTVSVMRERPPSTAARIEPTQAPVPGAEKPGAGAASLTEDDRKLLDTAVDAARSSLPTADKSEEAIRQNILTADKSITYEHLKKDADRYAGRPWVFSGTIYQINEKGGQTTALVSLDPWGNKNVWVMADFPTEFVEKNRVYVVGHIAGNYSYESVAGWNITVPAVIARAIMKPSEAAKYSAAKK